MSNSKFLRKYLNLLNEGPPPGVGPNAVVKGPNQQMGQPDTFTKMLPGMGNKAINAGKGLIDPYGKTMANFTPGSEYYQKNVANNPQVKAQVDAFMQNAPTASQLGSNVNATQQAFNKATQPTTAGGTSSEYEKSATQLGMPQVQEEEKDDTKVMRKYVDYIDEMSAREQDMQRRMANTRQAGANVAPNTSQTTSGPNGSMTVTKTGPATAINPNDKNAAAFGKQINAPAQTSIAQTNTAAAAPAAPAKTYGGGYDPSKVQYAYSGGKPTQPVAPNVPPGLAAATTGQGYADQANKSPTQAPEKQNTAAPANMGGYAQSAQPNPTPPAPLAGAKTTSQPVNNQSSGYTAQSQAQQPAAAPTFTGMAGNTQPAAQSSLSSQYVSANQPQTAAASTTQPTSDVLATQALQAQDQGTSGASKGIPAAFGQVAEEKDDGDDELARIKKLIRK